MESSRVDTIGVEKKRGRAPKHPDLLQGFKMPVQTMTIANFDVHRPRISYLCNVATTMCAETAIDILPLCITSVQSDPLMLWSHLTAFFVHEVKDYPKFAASLKFIRKYRNKFIHLKPVGLRDFLVLGCSIADLGQFCFLTPVLRRNLEELITAYLDIVRHAGDGIREKCYGPQLGAISIALLDILRSSPEGMEASKRFSFNLSHLQCPSSSTSSSPEIVCLTPLSLEEVEEVVVEEVIPDVVQIPEEVEEVVVEEAPPPSSGDGETSSSSSSNEKTPVSLGMTIRELKERYGPHASKNLTLQVLDGDRVGAYARIKCWNGTNCKALILREDVNGFEPTGEMVNFSLDKRPVTIVSGLGREVVPKTSSPTNSADISRPPLFPPTPALLPVPVNIPKPMFPSTSKVIITRPSPST